MLRAIEDFQQNMAVRVADVTVVGAAITSPWWIDTVSTHAAKWLPILGCIWIVVQILCKLWITSRGKKD